MVHMDYMVHILVAVVSLMVDMFDSLICGYISRKWG